MVKVYLSPSDQTSNRYAVGNTNEAAQCREICLLAVKSLKRCGIDAKTNTSAGMVERVAESNAWGANLHVPVHTNAFDTKKQGTLLMCYSMIGSGYKASNEILKTLSTITPGGRFGFYANPGLYEIRASNAPCAYVEAAFHDNREEAQWIIDHKTEIAEAITEGICNYFGLAYVPPTPEKPEQDPEPETRQTYSLDFRVMRKGDKGEDVKAMQTLLAGVGIYCVADGDFGTQTEKAVKQYQKKKGLTGDGIAGAETMGSLLGLS